MRSEHTFTSMTKRLGCMITPKYLIDFTDILCHSVLTRYFIVAIQGNDPWRLTSGR